MGPAPWTPIQRIDTRRHPAPVSSAAKAHLLSGSRALTSLVCVARLSQQRQSPRERQVSAEEGWGLARQLAALLAGTARARQQSPVPDDSHRRTWPPGVRYAEVDVISGDGVLRALAQLVHDTLEEATAPPEQVSQNG